MNKSSNNTHSETVLILAPMNNDAGAAETVLSEVSIQAQLCRDLLDLCRKLDQQSWGAVIISEEAITKDGMVHLRGILEKQDTWSDIPIILLTKANVIQASEVFSASGNISLLERPFSRLTFVRSVEVALRSRRKQYQVRDLLVDLQKSKEDAIKANLSKSEFLANMSHEIRTPIGAILGFTDLMKSPDNALDDNLNYMKIVERNSQHLLRLIDDILDLSKVEAGKMTVEKVNFSLADLLTDFKSIMAFKASEKGITFQIKVTSLVPNQINSDPVRLKQILSNIVGNAIKFTETGSVTLTVEFESPYLVFCVQDTGVGIQPSQKEQLFLPFSQADASTTRKFGGTGLGLVLSKHLATLLGGSLELTESTPGKGSTFTIRIKPLVGPQAQMVDKSGLVLVNPAKSSNKMNQALLGLTVLLVEDAPDNQKLVSLFLQKMGAKVEIASDGRQGIDMAISKHFDVVLMDIQMPNMDGHEATRTLRQMNYSKPIIALTAHAMKEERDRCFNSGFTDYLTKPIPFEKLQRYLTQYLPTY